MTDRSSQFVRATIIAIALFSSLAPARRDEPPVANEALVHVPAGFRAELFADDDLAHDIFAMTVDDQGRVVVSGPGYIRTLHDDNGDGRADRFTTFADGPKSGAQGLLFAGGDLFCTGDAGLIRYRDADGDDQADGPPETLLAIKTGGEHHAHAIRRGSDGFFYLIAGNYADVTAKYVTSPSSPIRDPQGGVLLRISPDFRDVQVFADGMRNAYDFAFVPNDAMASLTAENPTEREGDGDRDVGGGAVWFDEVIHATRGFSIFAYDSDGERDVTLPWYRPTRVFELLPERHCGWVSRSWKRPNDYFDMPPVLAELGRGSPTGVEFHPGDQFPAPFQNTLFVADWTFGRIVALPLERRSGAWRATPIEFMTGVGQFGFAPTDLATGPDGSLFVSVGGRGTRGGVFRVTAEAGVERRGDREGSGNAVRNNDRNTAAGSAEDTADLWKVWRPGIDFPNRRSPSAVDEANLASFAEAAERFVDASARDRLVEVRRMQLSLGDMGPGDHAAVFDGYRSRWKLDDSPRRNEIVAAARPLAAKYPTGDSRVDAELARLFSMLRIDDGTLLDRVLALLTDESHPTDDLHQLIVAASLPAARTADQRQRIARGLLSLEPKTAERELAIDSNWDPRLGELYAELVRLDPDLPGALLDDPSFGHAGHVKFAADWRNDMLHRAAERFAARLRASQVDAASQTRGANDAATGDVMKLLARADLSAYRPLLHKLAERWSLRDDAIGALAAEPHSDDRPLFVAGLDSPQLDVVATCVAALSKLTSVGQFEELASDEASRRSEASMLIALVHAARRLGADKREHQVREQVMRLLEKATRSSIPFVYGEEGHRPQPEAIAMWFTFLGQRYPDTSRNVAARDSDAGADDLLARLAKVEWDSGDERRGRSLFERQACSRCHDSSTALGPSLRGVARRFSRQDLFTAIADPNRDVSPRYRTELVETVDGHIFTGLVVYEAVDGVTLRDGMNRTIRVDAGEIESRRASATSLMPAGLLNNLTERDLADLYAYLHSLKP